MVLRPCAWCDVLATPPAASYGGHANKRSPPLVLHIKNAEYSAEFRIAPKVAALRALPDAGPADPAALWKPPSRELTGARVDLAAVLPCS